METPLTLSEAAELTQMSLPTTIRYLRTLKDLGYLIHDPATKRYALTSKVLSLGFSFLNKMDIRARLNPYLISLNLDFNVTANLAVLDNTDIVFMERITAAHITALNLTVGSRLPAQCTSLGKAILAFTESDALQKILDQIEFKQLTPHTIIDRYKLEKELEKTKKRGYAIALQETSLGWANYAVPIFSGKHVEAAIGVSFPYNFLKEKELVKSMVNRLLKITKEVSVY